ncbi:MAG: hypothetical protein K6G81_04955 [Lachnospiraceae bacterium]|nr:hypothetical protein [Lachnospiraceae bacterium]
MAKKKSNGIAGTIIALILMAAIIIGFYLMITRDKREGKLEPNVEVSEASTLLARDLSKDYPQTPREVVKLYCRITKCLYNEELGDKQIEDMVGMLRELYSDELLAQNPADDMVGLVRGEIKHYQSSKMTINSYSIDDSGDIVYNRNIKPAQAVVNIYFTIKEEGVFNRAYEEIMLVEAEPNKWKIMGWRESKDTSLKPEEN